MSGSTAHPDPWSALGRHTAARIALGRAGGSLPTRELLRFSYDHAEARDAVHCEFDLARLEADLAKVGSPILRVASRATDRLVYLQRPDLGGQLDDASKAELPRVAASQPDGFDLALIIADGLSATASQKHAAALVTALVDLLRHDRIRLAPLILARFARVALEDEIGHLLRARASLILLGERPGLGAADSLGAYLVFDPKPGRSNADRNCVSNIRPAGLSSESAAHSLHYLLTQCLQRQISGIHLKDEREGTMKQMTHPGAQN
jgi:ethanolamine ammonia-lyase small subunit